MADKTKIKFPSGIVYNFKDSEARARLDALGEKGSAGGVAELDENGKVLAAQLPSCVDDVLEYASIAGFPVTGETGKIYIDLTSNLAYRWGGSAYTEISPSLALGETSATAYRGDRGKTAYDHSQSTGNPHGTTVADLGAVPTSRTINGKALSENITLNASDVGAELYVVNITQVSGNYVSDKTYAQVLAAYQAGYTIIAKLGVSVFQLYQHNGVPDNGTDYFQFARILAYGGLLLDVFALNADTSPNMIRDTFNVIEPAFQAAAPDGNDMILYHNVELDYTFKTTWGDATASLAKLDEDIKLDPVQAAIKDVTVSSSVNLSTNHNNRRIRCTNSDAITITIQTQASGEYATEHETVISSEGTGQVTLALASGVSVVAIDNTALKITKGGSAVLHKIASNSWKLDGALET